MLKKLFFILLPISFLALLFVYYINSKPSPNRVTFPGENTWIETIDIKIEGMVINNYSGVTINGPILADTTKTLVIETQSGKITTTYQVGLTVSPCIGKWGDKAGIKLTNFPAHEITEGQTVSIKGVKAKMSYKNRVWEEVCIEKIEIVN